MSGRVGAVYADALYALCIETDTLEPVYTALGESLAVFDDNPQLYELLSVPTIGTEEKLALVKRLFSGQDYVTALLSMLTERGRISALPQVYEAFNAHYREAKNMAEMVVTTCVPLSDPLRKKLVANLQKRFGKDVQLTERIDPSLLGGMVVRYGDTVLDSSIKTQLETLRKQLRQ